ncbi:MAG: tRNA (adenosine(37)-N6)-threonylcarbamoyltransferase complex dimerization subunit type 1 TsaB [Fimbriimonadaceae bacterium]|nr:tRNA (adenosine(37)-N6)-threonylcarbamoyltransferase complex dimerization subunit type 1 TsaB [Fimbriimonadaceae bacterium]
MILTLSTSSPIISAALGERGKVQFSATKEGHRRASELVIDTVEEVLSQAKVDLKDLEGIVVDVGPGGFTSVRVGVTVAKMWGTAFPLSLYAVSAFDLINPGGDAAIAGRSDEIVVRREGKLETYSEWPDVLGYGVAKDDPTFPEARRAFLTGSVWRSVRPQELVPDYIHPPRISQPKTPFGFVPR